MLLSVAALLFVCLDFLLGTSVGAIHGLTNFEIIDCSSRLRAGTEPAVHPLYVGTSIQGESAQKHDALAPELLFGLGRSKLDYPRAFRALRERAARTTASDVLYPSFPLSPQARDRATTLTLLGQCHFWVRHVPFCLDLCSLHCLFFGLFVVCCLFMVL